MATKQTRSHEHAAPDYFYARCEQGARANLAWRLGLPVPA